MRIKKMLFMVATTLISNSLSAASAHATLSGEAAAKAAMADEKEKAAAATSATHTTAVDNKSAAATLMTHQWLISFRPNGFGKSEAEYPTYLRTFKGKDLIIDIVQYARTSDFVAGFEKGLNDDLLQRNDLRVQKTTLSLGELGRVVLGLEMLPVTPLPNATEIHSLPNNLTLKCSDDQPPQHYCLVTLAPYALARIQATRAAALAHSAAQRLAESAASAAALTLSGSSVGTNPVPTSNT